MRPIPIFSQSSQSIEEDGKVHKHTVFVIVIIKDWQLSIAFGHQKSQVNSQVQLVERDRGQKVEGRNTRKKRRHESKGGWSSKEEGTLSYLSRGTARQVPVLMAHAGAPSPAWAGGERCRLGWSPGTCILVHNTGDSGTRPLLEICWYCCVHQWQGPFSTGACIILCHCLAVFARSRCRGNLLPLSPLCLQYSQAHRMCLIKTVFVE